MELLSQGTPKENKEEINEKIPGGNLGDQGFSLSIVGFNRYKHIP